MIVSGVPADSTSPRAERTRRRRLVLAALAAAAAAGVLYVGVPAVAGLDETWARFGSGDPLWLVAALLLELLSFAAYMALFRTVFGGGRTQIGWSASYRITMAGVVATRLLAVAGAGGIALTAWALRRLGMSRREVAARMGVFFILLYATYMAALVVGGVGLRTGVLSGPAPPGLTVAPAAAGAAVILTVLLIAALSDDLGTVLDHSRPQHGWRARIAWAAAAAPATVSSGVRGGIALLRARRPGLLGAIGWFGFDIAVLWACLEAFGAPPTPAVVVMAYFVGMAANTLPVPGGIGAVDGGMIGALIGFGVDGGLAIVGVLTYRALAFWLPILPGAVAYLQLLRSPSRVGAGAAT